MEIIPHIFNAKVMHKRLFPKENIFFYKLYYLALPLPAPIIQRTFLKFDPKDLGFRDGRDPLDFAKHVLSTYGFETMIHNIILFTMPKVLGYVFNPVSFYFCLDKHKKLLAVIAEVHNTFGEQHTYFCAQPDHGPLEEHHVLVADKVFHVSPFLPRDGTYRFRFSLKDRELGIWIDYYDDHNTKNLVTSLTGTLIPLNSTTLSKAFWGQPFLTMKVICMIHLQAIKLWGKKIAYFKKPPQRPERISATKDLVKNEPVKKQ